MRTFDTFTQPLTELIEARIWAGLHYRSADVAGPGSPRPERGQLRRRELPPARRQLTLLTHDPAWNEKARSRWAFSTSRRARETRALPWAKGRPRLSFEFDECPWAAARS